MVQFHRDWLFQLEIMQQEMNRLLDHLAGSKPPIVRFSPSAWEPAIDVLETDDDIIVTVELAGISESEVEMLINSNTFIVRGRRNKRPQTSGKCLYHQMEITSGPFEKSVALPAVVDTTATQATYNNGLIEVVLPKVKNFRSLNVKSKISD